VLKTENTEKINILLVDDSEHKLLTYEAILGELGQNLIKCKSASEALEALLKNDISLVLLDVCMPDIDGFQLAEMIRKHPRFRKTPIIFISAIQIADLDRVKGYERGALDYISMPINPELLRAKVSVYLELHRRTTRLEEMNAHLSRLSRHLFEAQDNERRRIARELHDSLGQELSCAKLMVDGLAHKLSAQEFRRPIADASEAIERALDQVRNISYLLHPPLLDDSGLASAVTWYVDGFGKRSNIITAVEVDPQKFPRLKREAETAIFRILQECLTNVLRHSGASRAWVSLAVRDDQVIAKVRDDGKGFPKAIAASGPEKLGVGMAGIKERAKELGGEVRLDAGMPGAIVEVRIPLKSALPAEVSAQADAPAHSEQVATG
jgi:signal transduction histidine kinase